MTNDKNEPSLILKSEDEINRRLRRFNVWQMSTRAEFALIRGICGS